MKQKALDKGWHTEKSHKKMYPNFDTGTNYDRRRAEAYKEAVKLDDALRTRLNDIDVTKQSYKQTKKMVDDLLDDYVVKMRDVKDRFSNSEEFINYQEMLNRSNIKKQQSLKM